MNNKEKILRISARVATFVFLYYLVYGEAKHTQTLIGGTTSLFFHSLDASIYLGMLLGVFLTTFKDHRKLGWLILFYFIIGSLLFTQLRIEMTSP